MLSGFDPKERKAIILFLAFLMLGVVYMVTHPEQFEMDQRGTLPQKNSRVEQYNDVDTNPPSPQNNVNNSYDTYN